MNYDVVFTNAFAEDLSALALYEAQFTLSVELSYERLDGTVSEIEAALSSFPARNAAKPYGFTDVLRRKLLVGKYSAFYWIDEADNTVYVDRILYSKANFNRIHFGN